MRFMTNHINIQHGDVDRLEIPVGFLYRSFPVFSTFMQETQAQAYGTFCFIAFTCVDSLQCCLNFCLHNSISARTDTSFFSQLFDIYLNW